MAEYYCIVKMAYSLARKCSLASFKFRSIHKESLVAIGFNMRNEECHAETANIYGSMPPSRLSFCMRSLQNMKILPQIGELNDAKG